MCSYLRWEVGPRIPPNWPLIVLCVCLYETLVWKQTRVLFLARIAIERSSLST